MPVTQGEVEAAAKALYTLLQDIINNRPLSGHDMPEFQLAKAALEAAERARWQPIETAPFVSAKRFWLGKQDAVPIIAWRYYHDGPWLSDGINVNVDAYLPTHWQPLPSPPETK